MIRANPEWCFPIIEGFCIDLAAMALHEAAHIVVALIVGIKVKRIGFEWKGLYTVRDPGPPLKNLVVTLAGPLMNAVMILAWHWCPTFGLANSIFAVGNLLPISGSDGERAVRCCQEMRKNHLSVGSCWSAVSRTSTSIRSHRSIDGWNGNNCQNDNPSMERKDPKVATQ